MAFDTAAVNDLYGQLVSRTQQLGGVQVIQHEPKAAPQSLPAVAVWWAAIAPVPKASGLASTTARVEFGGRVYLNAAQKPEDKVDPQLILLTSNVIGAYSDAFTLNGDALAVDLLGAWGGPLSATAGYITHDAKLFRVAELTIPFVVDDIWIQEA